MTTLLKASNICAGYEERDVFSELSLELKSGEFVALIGRNGSGKSTLLRSLLGMEHLRAGRIELTGRDLKSLSRREIAKRATLVPQEAGADGFSLPVQEVVALGRMPHLGRFQSEGEADARAIRHAMEVTETSGFIGRSLQELSGGEKQRVALARALAQETDLLLLDEPTANLDLAHQLEILELVQSIVKSGRCALMAIHDLSLAARFCDRILCLSGGRIAIEGKADEVLQPENLREYFGVMADVIEHEGLRLLALRREVGKE